MKPTHLLVLALLVMPLLAGCGSTGLKSVLMDPRHYYCGNGRENIWGYTADAERENLQCGNLPCAMYGKVKMAYCEEKQGNHEKAIATAEGMMREYAQYTYAPGVRSDQRDIMEGAKAVAFTASKKLGDEQRAAYWYNLMEKNRQGVPAIMAAAAASQQ